MIQTAPDMPGVNICQPPWPGGDFCARRAALSPVDGSKIDVHAGPPQQVGLQSALGLGDWKSLRRRQVTG